MSIERYGVAAAGSGGPTPPFAKAVRAGDLVFVSGQVPFEEDGTVAVGGIEVQARRAIENVRAILVSIGLDLKDVVKATVWLDDTRDFWAFNRVYAKYFGEALPARSCVRADMMIDCKVEIEVVAYAPKK